MRRNLPRVKSHLQQPARTGRSKEGRRIEQEAAGRACAQRRAHRATRRQRGRSTPSPGSRCPAWSSGSVPSAATSSPQRPRPGSVPTARCRGATSARNPRCRRSSTSAIYRASASDGRSSRPAPSTSVEPCRVWACRAVSRAIRSSPRSKGTPRRTRSPLCCIGAGCVVSRSYWPRCPNSAAAIWSAGVRHGPATAACCWNAPPNDSAIVP